MFPYKATQYDTFMALVQASNPGLDIAPLTSDQLRALVPTAVTADSFGRDTSVRLMVKPGNSKYFGSQTVLYRRINLTNYFRNMGTLTLSDYVASGNLPLAQMVSSFNTRYGVPLVAADLSGSIAQFASGTVYGLTMGTASLCYKGSFNFKWTLGKQQISAAIANPVLTGRLYPGGNSMPPAKPQADFLTYNLDCSSIKASLLGIPTGSTITPGQLATVGSIYASVLSFLQQKRPDLNLNASDQATTGGLGNLVWTKFTIPSASVQGANSAKYTTVMLITAKSTSWFQGVFYLHYNA